MKRAGTAGAIWRGRFQTWYEMSCIFKGPPPPFFLAALGATTYGSDLYNLRHGCVMEG